MDKLDLTHCENCGRLEPRVALQGGVCPMCLKIISNESCHRYRLVLCCTLAVISTAGLVAMLVWG